MKFSEVRNINKTGKYRKIDEHIYQNSFQNMCACACDGVCLPILSVFTNDCAPSAVSTSLSLFSVVCLA